MKRAKKRYTLDRRLLRLAELASENVEESFGALESVAFVLVLLPHAALAPLPLSSRRRVILGFLLSRRRIENCKSTPWIMFLLLRFLFLLLHLGPRRISCSTRDSGNLVDGEVEGDELGEDDKSTRLENLKITRGNYDGSRNYRSRTCCISRRQGVIVEVEKSSLVDLYVNFNASNTRSCDESLNGHSPQFPASPVPRFSKNVSRRRLLVFLSSIRPPVVAYALSSRFLCAVILLVVLVKFPARSRVFVCCISSHRPLPFSSSISSSHPLFVFSSSRERLIMPTMSLRFLTENCITRH